MKWIILLLFAAAGLSSLLWFESSERKFTPAQRTGLGVIAITGWALVLVLGNVLL